MIAFIMVRMNKSKIWSHLQFKQTEYRRSNVFLRFHLYYQTFWDVDRIRSCAGETPIDFYYNILQVHLFFTITHTIADTASKVKTDQK